MRAIFVPCTRLGGGCGDNNTLGTLIFIAGRVRLIPLCTGNLKVLILGPKMS